MYKLDLLEKYLVNIVQPAFKKEFELEDEAQFYWEIKMEPVRNAISLMFLSMRVSLHSIINNQDIEKHALLLETHRKQFENLKSCFSRNKTLFKFFDEVNRLMDYLSECLEFRGYAKHQPPTDKKFPPLKISNFCLVQGNEENYKEILIYALYVISSFLSPTWFTEGKKLGDHIDGELKNLYYCFGM